MDRRSVLKTVSILVGGSLSVGTVSAVMSGCKPSTGIDWTPKILSNDQARIVAEVVDIILPETDTPGAKELMVGRFVDSYLNDCYGEDAQKVVLEGINTINVGSKSAYGKDFVKATREQQTELIKGYDDAAFSGESKEKHFFRYLKELTLTGYFSTEVGQTQVLQHIAVPGPYKGCVPLAEAGEGRAWAQS